MKIIDLHTHSNISDGSMTPEDLVFHAKEAGLAAVALTDHDTADGIARGRKAAKAAGIEFIPGIEFAAYYNDKEVHIVGLFIDETNYEFIETTKKIAESREKRNAEMIQKMQAAGIDITLHALYAEEGGGILTRANFAACLMRRGIVASLNEAFEKYLDIGRPFYIPRNKLLPTDVIEQIHNAGGIAILAHPLLYHFDESPLDTCVANLKALGIDGLEAYYSRNKLFDTGHMKTLAKKYQLLLSGGSDFHGSYKPDIQIGRGTGNLIVPYDLLEPLKQKSHSKRHPL